VLLLSRDDAYGVLNKFIAAEIIATIRQIPIEVRPGRRVGDRGQAISGQLFPDWQVANSFAGGGEDCVANGR
jgi:hypothetical protein